MTQPDPTKPTIAQLGIDAATLDWRSAGGGPGAIEIAFTSTAGQEWVFLRVVGDPERRVSVFTRYEWDCFLDGAKNGEFDFASP